MKKIVNFMLAGALSALSLSALCACKKDDTLKISEVTHSVFYAPLYLADALGYLKDEGITIELTNAGGADNVMASVLSGGADIGFCGPEASLYVLAGGSTDAPEVIGQLTKRDGSFLVSREKEDNFEWSQLEGKNILAGRKGGVPAMTFEYVLKKNNVTATLNFDVAFNLMTAAFEGGTGDYCTMFEPTASEYEKAGKGYIVASVGEASGEIPYTCFLAKKSYIQKNEDKIISFLTAITKATKYALSSSSDEVAKLLAPYFEGTDVSSLKTSMDSYKKIDSWMTNMAMKEDSLDRLQDVIELAGELPKRVDFDDLVENKYAQKAYDAVYGR